MIWDGSDWEGVGGIPDNEGTELSAVSCTSATSCMAVGSDTEDNEEVDTLAVHWDGAKWTRELTPNGSVAADENRFAGVSCTSSACRAVGSYKDGEDAWTLAARTP